MNTRVLLILLLLCFQSVASAQNTATHSVYFDTDKSELTPTELNELSNWIKGFKSSTITAVTITAYCDDVASDAYNQELSQRRAEQVKNELGRLNVNGSLITQCQGNGEVALASNTNTDEQRAENRRADIQITYEPEGDEETVEIIHEPASEEPQLTLANANMDSLKVGDRIVLENILFEGGRHYLLEESYFSLAQVIEILSTNTQYQFAIQGHVCCTPAGQDGLDTDTGLQNLSEARAEVIYDFLVREGVDPDRMTHEGFGGDFPLGGDVKYDRRVEIEITGIIEE